MRIFLLAATAATLAACQGDPPPANDQQPLANLDTPAPGAPLGAVLDPASADNAADVARRFSEAVGSGRFDEAFALTAPEGDAAVGGSAAFAARFAGRTGLVLTIGEAGDPVKDGEASLVEVPAALNGVDPAGKAFRVEGPLILRLSKETAGPDETPHWRIVRAPFPA